MTRDYHPGRQCLWSAPDSNEQVECLWCGAIEGSYCEPVQESARIMVPPYLVAVLEGLATKLGREADDDRDAVERRRIIDAELRRDRIDANRYRWLRDRLARMQKKASGQHRWYLAANGGLVGPTFDAAIDAAMVGEM